MIRNMYDVRSQTISTISVVLTLRSQYRLRSVGCRHRMPNTLKIVKHALRTLIKAGDPDALSLLGFSPPTDVVVEGFVIDRETVDAGGELTFDFAVTNNGSESVTVVIDYIVHHVKANGTTTPKVFKLTTRTLEPGVPARIAKRHSFKPISTRKYYAGEHAVEVQINGVRQVRGVFRLDV